MSNLVHDYQDSTPAEIRAYKEAEQEEDDKTVRREIETIRSTLGTTGHPFMVAVEMALEELRQIARDKDRPNWNESRVRDTFQGREIKNQGWKQKIDAVAIQLA